MKKLLASIAAMTLAIVATFSMASCEQLGGLLENILPKDSSTTPADSSTPPTSSTPDKPAQAHEADLNDVKDFVYTPMLDEATESTRSYTVQNSYSFYGQEAKYDISWAVTDADGNAIDGVSIVEGETEDTVEIAATLAEDVAYVLTGTITCPDGCCSISFTLNRVAVAAPAPVAITEAPVEGTAYKFYVYQGNKKVDCYPTGNMANTYYFETSTDYEEGIDLYVKNVEGGFYLYHVVNDVDTYINVVKSGTHTNAKYQTLEENATPSVWTFNTEWQTIATTLSDGTYYLGCDGSYDTVEPQYKTEDGYFMGYLVTMVDKSELVITDEKKVADIKKDLNVQENHTVDKTVELTTADDRYPEATITWAVEENKGATVTNEGLVLVIPAEATTATLTATIKVGDVTDTKEFTLTLGPKTVAPDSSNAAAIVEAAFSLAANEELPGGNYTLTGEITEVNSAWSDQYKNITVTISVNDKEIECYRLASGTDTDASALKVGDTITVTGKIKNYKGKVEFDQGCTLDAVVAGEGGEVTPEYAVVTIPEAIAAEDGTKVQVSGTVCEINTVWSEQHSNISVTIEDADGNKLYLYRLATKVELGDIITVKGAMATYNGRQIGAGATAEITGHDNSYDYTEMSIVDAIAAEDGTNVIVTGTVTEIHTPYSEQHGNISVYIADDANNTLYLYRLSGNVEVGNIIKVKGTMATYNDNRQLTGGTFELISEGEEVTPPVEEPEIPSASTTVTVSIADYAATNGWTNSTQYTSITMNDDITVTANGGQNTGKYYDSGTNWRIYQTESPSVVITAAEGKTIVSVKITYVIHNTGILTQGDTQIESEAVVEVNANSVTFGVGNTGTATNGQVRITAIEVVYA